MASPDQFSPRVIAELNAHLDTAENHHARRSGLPDDYYYMGTRSKKDDKSQVEQLDHTEVPPPAGEVVWTEKQYLKRVNIDQLRASIRLYKKRSRKMMTRPEIRRELFRVLNVPGLASIVIPFRHIEIPAGTDVFRARRIQNLEEIRTQSDVWTAPPKYIGAGRVNDLGEPLLYTASNPLTAAFEVHAQPNDLIAMSHFRTTRRVLAVDMASDITVAGLRMVEQRKLGLIMQFLESVFSQRVPPSASYRYIAPDLVAKEIFNPFPDLYTGWCYRSVADTRGVSWAKNLALKGSMAPDFVQYMNTQVVRVDPAEGLLGRHQVLSLLQDGGDRLVQMKIPAAEASPS